ncbi:hypothetical protein [Desulfitobacterium sp. AusDCA]|uniref:hypothetical protein n=1 Tax=Desulfitobacterium sp. AusDCA TaxID=3240383 RepID=UPI003DA71C57
MKIKPWLKYLIYIILLFFLIALREYVEKLFLNSYHRFKYPEIFYYLVVNVFLGICIGLFLGLEHLIEELGKEGTWKINLTKLILVGLPSLYFSLANIWVLSGNRFMQELLYLNRYGSGYVSLFQMIFGYMVITSFFKYNEKI